LAFRNYHASISQIVQDGSHFGSCFEGEAAQGLYL
jgi:hypothetical protein